MPCDCDFRQRRWNPASGRCETCGMNLPTPAEQVVALVAPSDEAAVLRRRIADLEAFVRAWEADMQKKTKQTWHDMLAARCAVGKVGK